MEYVLTRDQRMSEPPAKDNAAEQWRAAFVVAVVKAIALTLLVTDCWGAAWVSHLVQDIRTWREFFLHTQAAPAKPNRPKRTVSRKV